MAKEALLQIDASCCVEFRPVFQAMKVEPFFLGAGLEEPLNVSTQMKALSAPIGRGE